MAMEGDLAIKVDFYLDQLVGL
ncbi:hypothetical protein, partial [Plasmodium yoelii yoelii]